MYRFIFPILLTGILFSCNSSSRHFEDFLELSPELEWKKEDSRSFTVEITDVKSTYNLGVGFRFAEGFAHRYLRCKLVRENPDNTVKVDTVEIKVIGENGEYLGDPGYDIWDREQVVFEGLIFETPGTYRFILSHEMNRDPVQLAMEIGLFIEKN